MIASIMTGTSVDGVDISIMTMNGEFVEFFEFDFKEDEKKYIEKFLWPTKANLAQISEFNFKFSKIVSEYVNKLPKKILNKVEYIVFHGQTVFHDPDMLITKFPSTLQLGNGGALSQFTKKNVICDLRSTDVAVGNQGAPLVGIGDKKLFWKKGKGVAIFNIGGISNVTVIKPNGKVSTFDLGAGNALMDAYVKEVFKLPYDDNGKIAASGKVIPELLKELNSHPFLKQKPPKSTGKEEFNIEFINKRLKGKEKSEDVLATLTMHTAHVLKSTQDFYNLDGYEILLGGGGFRNATLMRFIKNFYPTITSTDVHGIDPQARESSAFAFIGLDYLNDVKNTTGKDGTIFGALYKYKK